MEIIKELSRIQKEIKANKSQFNNFGKYKYRSCEDILQALKPIMSSGFTIQLTDEIQFIGDRYYVKAKAIFTNGEEKIETVGFARESEIKKGMDTSQVTGASSSYARKYALSGLLALDDNKDSDFNKNQEKTNKLKKTINKTQKELQTLNSVIPKGVHEGKKWKQVIDAGFIEYALSLKEQAGREIFEQEVYDYIKLK